jgi:hypothetical protein
MLFDLIHKNKERKTLSMVRVTTVSIPFPSKWYIHADIAGRPIVWGELSINSIRENRLVGTINFRGTPIPIQGHWNEGNKQITFDSPYATFTGNLNIVDESSIRIRHFILRGRFIMKPSSLHAGEYGTWIATTDISMNGDSLANKYTNQLPPIGAF